MATNLKLAAKKEKAIESDKAQAAHTILQRSIVLVLSCSAMGNRKHVALDDIEMKKGKGEKAETIDDGEKKQLSMSKQLIDSKILTPAHAALASAKSYLRSVSTSGHRVFGPGTYLIPMTLVGTAEERLEQYRKDLGKAVDDIVKAYPAAVEKAKEALGPVFNAHDYLSPEEVRNEFDLDWSYVSFNAPENLESVDRAIYNKAVKKHENRFAAAYDEVIAGLRGDALAIVKSLHERLQPGDDGKPKALRGTALRDLEEYIKLLPDRNITDDDELKKVMADIQKALAGTTIDDIRGSQKVRTEISAMTDAAVKKLEALVTDAPIRAIRLRGAGAE